MSGRRELSRQEQIHRYFPQRSVQGAVRARSREEHRRAEPYQREVHQASSFDTPPPPADPSPPIAPSDVEEEDLAVEFPNEASPDMQAGILASLQSFTAEELRQARLTRHFRVKLEADTAEVIRHSLENAEATTAPRRRTLG